MLSSPTLTLWVWAQLGVFLRKSHFCFSVLDYLLMTPVWTKKIRFWVPAIETICLKSLSGAGWSTGMQTGSLGISRPGRILCGMILPCLYTLLCNFNMVLFSTLLWAVKLFLYFALEAAPFQGDMWFLHSFTAHKWNPQQMARSSPRWCALLGHGIHCLLLCK